MWTDQKQSITPRQAVAGIINGMIGSIALLLPQLALRAGYITTLIIILVFGCAMAFSSWIYSLHLGDEPDTGHSLGKHFDSKFKAKFCYDLFVWLFIICLCIQYFQLIVAIWRCIITIDFEKDSYYYVSSSINVVVILAYIWLLKKVKVGEKSMIYGIISIGQYLLFLMVYFLQNNNKPIQKEFDAIVLDQFDSIAELTASMSQAFMIQVFLIPVLKRIKNQEQERSNFIKYTIYSYIIGGVIYLFIAEIGGLTIMHLDCKTFPNAISQNPFPEAIGLLTYFEPDSWLKAICFIYILHIYSVYPQYILLSKKIFFQNIQRFLPQRWTQILKKIYIPFFILICGMITAFQVPIKTLMVINGGTLGCIITFIIPAVLHIYCMTSSNIRRDPFSKSIRQSQKKQDKKSKVQSIKEPLDSEQSSDEPSQGRMQSKYCACKCDHNKRSNLFKRSMTIFLIFFALFGGFSLFASVYSIVNNDSVQNC